MPNSKTEAKIFACSQNKELAENIATAFGVKLGNVITSTYSDGEFQLTITATATETNPTSGDATVTTLSAQTSATIDVQVDAVADAPTLNVTSSTTGDEDGAIALTSTSNLVDADTSETLSIEITGRPGSPQSSAVTGPAADVNVAALNRP